MLQGFLQHARDRIMAKCAGLSADQLAAQAAPPSALSLLGVIRHLTDVERHWVQRRFAGHDLPLWYGTSDRPEAAIERATAKHAQRDLRRLQNEWIASDSALSRLDLSAVFHSARWGEMTLRWGYLHLVREYSAHGGQADMLRKQVDGRTSL